MCRKSLDCRVSAKSEVFICLYMCNQSTCSEPTTTPKFTKLVLSVLLAVHRGLCRIFHPCNIVPQFPFLAVSTTAFLTVPLFHVSHFQSIPYLVERCCITVSPCPAIIWGKGVLPLNIWKNGVPPRGPRLHHWRNWSVKVDKWRLNK